MHQKHPPANVAFSSRRPSAPCAASFVAAAAAPITNRLMINNPSTLCLFIVNAPLLSSLSQSAGVTHDGSRALSPHGTLASVFWVGAILCDCPVPGGHVGPPLRYRTRVPA